MGGGTSLASVASDRGNVLEEMKDILELFKNIFLKEKLTNESDGTAKNK